MSTPGNAIVIIESFASQRVPGGVSVNLLRGAVSVGVIVFIMTLVGAWLESESRLHAQGQASLSLIGAWTLDKDVSESPDGSSPDGRDHGGNSRGRRRGGGGGGGFGRGGFGGRGGADGGRFDREEMSRQRDALREIMNPPSHLTIVQANNMIVITGPDGRTTRLSPDGQKVSDEATKTERKTKWDGGKLVSEISGLAAGKITETYSVDPEHHRLRIVAHIDNARRPTTTTHVYAADGPSQ